MSGEENKVVLTGTVGIVGPTNVGKSTLLNLLAGTKVAIVTPRPQTTRNRIMAAYREEGIEIVFIDTPGLHTPKGPLQESMVASARAAISEVDIIALMISAQDPFPREMEQTLKILCRVPKPRILLLNKIDLVKDYQDILDQYQGYEFHALMGISALHKQNIMSFIRAIKPYLKPGPPLIPEDTVSPQTFEFWVSELIREKIFLLTKQELPYSCAVTVDSVKRDGTKDMVVIQARIHVERESQKGILIGEQGTMIKKIGQRVREELEIFLGKKVYLELFVRVEKNWTRDPKALQKLGY